MITVWFRLARWRLVHLSTLCLKTLEAGIPVYMLDMAKMMVQF